MIKVYFLHQLLIVITISYGTAQKCPQGGDIYSKGISNQGKIDVISAHNQYRLQIARGNVILKGLQSRYLFASPILPAKYECKSFDNALALEGRPVSDSCTMAHIIASDSRWSWVGQNLYIEWSTRNASTQNWNAAVKSWFDENKDFIYPDKKTNDTAVVGHYTQVVWSNSKMVGCDFIHFYDVTKPKYPYAKLYTCNYGPGGNYVGEAPYLNGTTGCENLC